MKKELFHTKHNAGLSLVEVVLASSLFLVVVMGLSGVLVYGQESTATGGALARATLLGDEGLSAFRNIRDSEPYSSLYYNSGGVDVVPVAHEWQYQFSSLIDSLFTREVRVSSYGAPFVRSLITSHVTWRQTPSRFGDISMISHFTDWRRSIASGGNWNSINTIATVPSTDPENGEKIQVVGEYAYIIRSGSNPDFLVYNITNPSAPNLVGSLTLSANPANLFVLDGYAYIASTDDNAELQVVRVISPSAPQLVGLYDAPGIEDGLGIYVAGTHAYLVRQFGVGVNNNFISLDVTNPNSPTLLGSTLITGTLFDIVVSGSYAYISSSDDSEELKIINVSDPTDTGLTRVPGLDFPGNSDSWPIALSGSNLIIDDGGWFIVVSISNPTNPVLLSNHQIVGNWWIYDISLSSAHGSNGHIYAFLTVHSPSYDFLVIDITNPSNPINVATYDNTGVGTMRGVAYSPLLDRVFVSAIDDKELMVFGPN